MEAAWKRECSRKVVFAEIESSQSTISEPTMQRVKISLVVCVGGSE